MKSLGKDNKPKSLPKFKNGEKFSRSASPLRALHWKLLPVHSTIYVGVSKGVADTHFQELSCIIVTKNVVPYCLFA